MEHRRIQSIVDNVDRIRKRGIVFNGDTQRGPVCRVSATSSTGQKSTYSAGAEARIRLSCVLPSVGPVRPIPTYRMEMEKRADTTDRHVDTRRWCGDMQQVYKKSQRPMHQRRQERAGC